MLRPGGRLMVGDFAAHEREDLRTADAVRIGFTDEAINGWFAAAGLTSLVEHLKGGELTVTCGAA